VHLVGFTVEYIKMHDSTNVRFDLQQSSQSLSSVKQSHILNIAQVFSSFFIPGCFRPSVMSYIGVLV